MNNLKRLRAFLEAEKVDGIFIKGDSSIRYFTGFTGGESLLYVDAGRYSRKLRNASWWNITGDSGLKRLNFPLPGILLWMAIIFRIRSSRHWRQLCRMFPGRM